MLFLAREMMQKVRKKAIFYFSYMLFSSFSKLGKIYFQIETKFCVIRAPSYEIELDVGRHTQKNVELAGDEKCKFKYTRRDRINYFKWLIEMEKWNKSS